MEKDSKQKLTPRKKFFRRPKLQAKTTKQTVTDHQPNSITARYLAKQLQLHAEVAKSFMKNISHFIELMKKAELVEPFLSFVVMSLFINVQLVETLEIIKKKYKPP